MSLNVLRFFPVCIGKQVLSFVQQFSLVSAIIRTLRKPKIRIQRPCVKYAIDYGKYWNLF